MENSTKQHLSHIENLRMDKDRITEERDSLLLKVRDLEKSTGDKIE